MTPAGRRALVRSLRRTLFPGDGDVEEEEDEEDGAGDESAMDDPAVAHVLMSSSNSSSSSSGSAPSKGHNGGKKAATAGPAAAAGAGPGAGLCLPLKIEGALNALIHKARALEARVKGGSAQLWGHLGAVLALTKVRPI